MTITVTSRSAGLLLAAALTLGWVSASLTQQPAPEQSSRGAARESRVAPAEVPRAERLRERLAEPPLPARGRNPFVFGSRTSAPARRDHQQHGDEVVAPAPMPR